MRPNIAAATYAKGELVVTVPKGASPDDGDNHVSAVLGDTESVLVGQFLVKVVILMLLAMLDIMIVYLVPNF
jgi:hypothetical protein